MRLGVASFFQNPSSTLRAPRQLYLTTVDSRELTLEMCDFRLQAESGQPADLVARARAGDLDAFDQIMRLHEKQVLSTALRLVGNLADAQDIAQETFLRLYRNLHKLPDALETAQVALSGDRESLQ